MKSLKAASAKAMLRDYVDSEKAAFFPRFFKTGPGEYGEGDRFLGVVVPAVRTVAKEFRELSLVESEKLLASPWNEDRLMALFILGAQYARASKKGDLQACQKIFKLYLKNKARVNNWNLVDASAPNIVGMHLRESGRQVVFKLARSKGLWDRRIAIVSSLAWIRRDDVIDTLRLCEVLIEDRHDLIQKACGWMLREVGKRDEGVLRDFLDQHATRMPRTMLRYSIERLSERERQAYLRKT